MAAKETKETDFEWDKPNLIRVEETFVDWDYQRDEKRRFAFACSQDFDKSLVGAIFVSRRPDGKLAVIDGQQRVLILRILGISTVYAIVYEGLTIEDEARKFASLNFARNAVSSWDHYRALRRARDPRVLGVDTILDRFDFEVGKQVDGNGTIGACGALLEIYSGGEDVMAMGSDLDGPEALNRTLETISRSWKGSLDFKNAKTSGMMRGVCRFVTAHTNVTPERSGEIFKLMSPSMIVEGSKKYTTGDGSGKGRGIEKVLNDLFNKHEGTETLGTSVRARRR